MMKKRFFSALLCLCLLIGLVPGAVTTAYAAWLPIGETVTFAGHEWYIIGTPTEGVTAPDGCYTLFAKDNDFDSTTFRAGADQYESGANIYKDSDLQKKMEDIANGFSEEDKANIVPRSTFDYIAGDSPANQLLWPISGSGGGAGHNTYYLGEVTAIDSSLLKFETSYWTRSNWTQSNGFTGDENKTYYHAITVSSDGGVVIDGLGLDIATASEVTETHAIRPALYVKQEAVTPLPSFYLSADTISNASAGGNLVANSGDDDTPLTRSENQDADIRAYSDGGTTQYGTSLLFNYLSATRGENQVVACVLTDEDGNVAYYGKLADRSDSAPDVDDVSVPLAGVAEGTYTLSIFSHNTATGEISEPSPTMTVTVVGSIGFVSNYDGDTYTKIEIVIPPNPGPAFIQHPQDQIIEENGSATFTAEAGGSDITYYWQAQPKSSDPDTGTWYDILIYVEDGVSVNRHSGQRLSLSNVSGTWQENGYTLDGGSGFDPADARFRCWAYTGGGTLNSYSNPAELTVIPSGGGEDGREVELRTTDTHIQWRYEGEGDDAWRDLVALSAITGGDGADGREIQLQVANGYIQWKYDTDTQWNDLLSLSELQGQDGREIELQNNGTAIQWRYEGETEWKDLVDLSAITGGDGREIQLRVDGGYIQWKYSTDPDTEWQNLIAVSALQGMKGDKGDKGDPGRDGSDGSDGRDGRDGKDGEDGEDGLTPFIGSNGNWWIGAADTGVPAAGADGAPGRDGVGISGLLINEAGELVITLTDGTENNLGRVTGEDGAGIAGISISEAGELIVTLTDGTELNAGVVPTNGPEMSCLRLLVYLALGMSALSLTGLLVAGGLWYRRRRASRS